MQQAQVEKQEILNDEKQAHKKQKVTIEVEQATRKKKCLKISCSNYVGSGKFPF